MNNVAFKMAYLLGVEGKVLEREYPDEFLESNELGKFELYKGVEELRALVRLRQSVVRYLEFYKNTESLTVSEMTDRYLDKEIEYLLTKNIDIELIFYYRGLVGYFNVLSYLIQSIVEKILIDLGLPRVDLLKEFFFYPEFTSAGLNRFSNEVKKLAKPHGVVLYKGSKLGKSLKYCLRNDENIFHSINRMLGKPDYISEDFTLYQEWDTRNLSSDEVITKELLEDIEGNKPIDLNRVIRDNNHNINIENKNFTKPVFSNEIRAYLTEDVEMFVDCDNTEFFIFFNFVLGIENVTKIKTIYLFADKKSNFLWKMFKGLYQGHIDIHIIQVERIKDNKSVVDLVLTKTICEAYYTNGLSKAILVSSDSDFYGLISTLTEIDYMVVYHKERVNDEYLQYLKNCNIPYMDLGNLNIREIVEAYKDTAIQYLLGYSMALTPITKWTDNSLVDLVYYLLNNESAIAIDKTYIEEKVNEFKDRAIISLQDREIEIKIDDVVVSTSSL